MLETRILLFIELAKSGSLDDAAKKTNLDVDQALRMIQSLENDLKCQLVSEYRKNYHLTRLGEKFYHGCTRLQEMAIDLMEEMNFTPVPRIAIGFSGIRDNQKVIELASRYKQLYPSTNFTYQKKSPKQMLESLFEQKIDVCFGLQNMFDERAVDLWIEPLFRYNICFIFKKDHPLALEKVIQPNRLEDENLLILMRQNGQNFYFDPFVACNIRSSVFTMQKREPEDLIHAILEGQGIGVTSEEMIDPAQLDRLNLTYAIYPNSYCVVIRAGESRDEILDFIRLAKEFFADFDLEQSDMIEPHIIERINELKAQQRGAIIQSQSNHSVLGQPLVLENQDQDKERKKELKKVKKELKAQLKLEKSRQEIEEQQVEKEEDQKTAE